MKSKIIRECGLKYYKKSIILKLILKIKFDFIKNREKVYKITAKFFY